VVELLLDSHEITYPYSPLFLLAYLPLQIHRRKKGYITRVRNNLGFQVLFLHTKRLQDGGRGAEQQDTVSLLVYAV